MRGAILVVLGLASSSFAGDLAGLTLLITTVRTGDTEVFAVDPDRPCARFGGDGCQSHADRSRTGTSTEATIAGDQTPCTT